MPELYLDRPGEPRRKVVLTTDVVALGKRADCDVVLESQFVSRQHARLERRGEAYELIDAGSLNGTLLNGKRIEAGRPHRLERGDEIAIADYAITYWEGDTDEATLPWDGPLPGTLFVDRDRRAVYVGTEPLPEGLTQLEFTLLSYLYDNQHKVCTNDEIGGHVWGTVVVNGKAVPQFDNTQLQQLIHRVRRKIEVSPDKRQFIQNVPGVGYRLITGRSS